LMELRQFRQHHPEAFRRIKGLPLRARVGRANPGRAGSTVTFIRSNRRDAFYRINPGESATDEAIRIDEIGLVEAAADFRADIHEKTISLHADHHDQINSALQRFRDSVVSEALQADIVDAAPGPNEQRALRYLDGLASLPFVNDEERALIQSAKLAVRRARFQNLQRQINQLQRSTKTVKLTPTALADKLIQILRTYPLQQGDASPVTTAVAHPLDTTPDIILSESFSSQ
ncbi:MAG TPA: helicase, partial [Clostridia bacterium]|nr:helicase [Clostridia bacterium]